MGYVTRSLRHPLKVLVAAIALQAVLSGCGLFVFDKANTQQNGCPAGSTTCAQGTSTSTGTGTSGTVAREFRVIPAVTTANANVCQSAFAIAVFEDGVEANTAAVDLRLSVTNLAGAEGMLGANCSGPAQTILPVGTTRVAFSFRSSTIGQARYEILDNNNGVATTVQWISFLDPNSGTPTPTATPTNTSSGGAPPTATYTPTSTSTPTPSGTNAGYQIRMDPVSTLLNGQCNSGYKVRLYVNNVLSNPNGVILNLSSPQEATPVTFVTGNSCTPGGTQINLAAGQTEAYVSIQAPVTVTGVRVLHITDANTGTGTFGELPVSVQFQASGNQPPTTATSILLVGPPGNVDAGTCTSITVNALNGNIPVVLANPLAVNLSFSPGDPPGTIADDLTYFYRNATCQDVDRITATSISAGTSSTTVWFTTKRALDYDLRGVSGVMQSTYTLHVRPYANGPKQVRISSLADSTTAGTCVPGVVALTDLYGNPLPSSSQTGIQLSLPGLSALTQPGIFNDIGCSSPAANRTVQVPPSQALASFFFSVTASSGPNGYRIEPTALGYTMIPRSIVVLPASANKIVIDSDPSGIDADFAGSCVNLVISLQDMYGNRVRNTGNGPMTVNVQLMNDPSAVDPSDLNRAWLTAGPNCPGNRNSAGVSNINVVIPDGGDNALASMVLYDAGAVTVKANKVSPTLPALAQGLFAVPPPFMVLPGDPAKTKITSVPAAPPRAGECIPIQYRIYDAYDNLTYARSNTPMQIQFAGYAFADRVPVVSLNANCSNPITPPNSSQPQVVNITAIANTQGGVFYVTHTVSETFRILVTGPSAIPPISPSPEVPVTFIANVPQQVVFLPESAPRARAGECSLPLILEVRDQYGNASAPTSPLSFNIVKSQSTPSGAVINFYADSGCSQAGANFNLLNVSRATFYAGSTAAGAYQIQARVLTSGWPFAGFPFPIQYYTVVDNPLITNMPVALDFFGPGASPLPQGSVKAGLKLGPLVLKPLNRSGAVTAADQTVNIRIDGRSLVNRAPMLDLHVYQASTTSCTATEIPSRQITLTGGQSESQPFCISGQTATARELVPVPVTPLYVGVRFGFVVTPGVMTQFRFVPNAPAVGRCTYVVLETRDTWNNLAPIIPAEDDPSSALAAIAEVYNLTAGASIYNDRNCYDAISSGELTLPSGDTRVSFYLLSNAVAGYSAIPVNVSARTVDPPLGVATTATLPMANGYPSNRTLLVSGIGNGGIYTTNTCRNATLNLVQQNSFNADPNTWANAVFPAPGEMRLNFGNGAGLLFDGYNCASGSNYLVVKPKAKGDLGQVPFSWKTGDVGPNAIVGNANYAGRLLENRVNFQMSAGSCTDGTIWDAPGEYADIGFGYFVLIYKRYRCDYGSWTLIQVWLSRLNNGCFSPETEIAMAGGLPRRADLVRVGDELWNPVLRQPSKVLQVVKGAEAKGLMEIRAGKQTSRVSTEHPMVTDRGLKQAADIVRGDKLRLSDGTFATVSRVRQLAPRKGQMVYNFILDVPDTAPAEAKLISGDNFVTGEWTLQKALRDNRNAKKGELP